MNSQTEQAQLTEAEELIEDRPYGVYWLTVIGTLVMLCLLPFEAPWIETKRGWFIQPMFGSGLGLGIVFLFALVRVIQSIKAGYLKRVNLADNIIETFSTYRTAIISSGLFFLYINTLSVLGFVLSTLLFVTTLLWLSRLLDRTWFLATLFTLTVMVLIFRVGVSVWLPDVWLYNLLPDQWAVFANQYL